MTERRRRTVPQTAMGFGTRDEWVRIPRNPYDDLDTGYTNAAYEARLEALPFDLLREVARGTLTIEEAEAQKEAR